MSATVALAATVSSTANQSVYTYSAVAIGDAASDRVVVVVAHARSGSGSVISGITVGGVAATKLVESSNATGGQSSVGIYGVLAPSGATADIVVTYGTEQLRSVVQVLRCTKIDLAAVADTATVASADRNSASLPIDNPAGGVVIAAGNTAGSSTTTTWANLAGLGDSEILDAPTFFRGTVGGEVFASPATNRAVSLSWGFLQSAVAAAVSLAPLSIDRSFQSSFQPTLQAA